MINQFYELNDTPQKLAQKIITKLSEEGPLTIPIDPFKLLARFGVFYQFREFDKLEGIYLVPKNKDDVAVVGINTKRPIERQRFTAAHELCHHIKDREDQLCPMRGTKSAIEKYADEFAAELLMPDNEFRREANKLISDGFVSFDNALLLSVKFGVSFEACVFRLAYKCRLIEGDTAAKTIKSRIRKFKPNKRKENLDLASFELDLLAQIVDSNTYFFEQRDTLIWNKFKNDYIYNESRLEGSTLDYFEVVEIITDLRLNKQNSEYCKSEFIEVIETAGQSVLYDFISNTASEPTIFSILDLHKMLFKYAPFPEAAGQFRTNNTCVSNSELETADYMDIFNRVADLDERLNTLLVNREFSSCSKYMEEAIKIHYELTTIHPFSDGNGRVSRTLLNWLFSLKKLPPVYLKHTNKEIYYDALYMADTENNFDMLVELFYLESIQSINQIFDSRKILK